MTFAANKYTTYYFNIIENARQETRVKGKGRYFENQPSGMKLMQKPTGVKIIKKEYKKD